MRNLIQHDNDSISSSTFIQITLKFFHEHKSCFFFRPQLGSRTFFASKSFRNQWLLNGIWMLPEKLKTLRWRLQMIELLRLLFYKDAQVPFLSDSPLILNEMTRHISTCYTKYQFSYWLNSKEKLLLLFSDENIDGMTKQCLTLSDITTTMFPWNEDPVIHSFCIQNTHQGLFYGDATYFCEKNPRKTKTSHVKGKKL